MIKINPVIEEFIKNLELHYARKLNYPNEIKNLLQIVFQKGLSNEFDELIFTAKFIIRVRELINRTGFGVAGFEKLTEELKLANEKAINLFKILIHRGDDDVIKGFDEKFLRQDQMNNLIDFYMDLNILKNWKLDGNVLPYESGYSLKRDLLKNEQSAEDKLRIDSQKEIFGRLKIITILLSILFILLILIDAPVTTLGWLLVLGIIGLLLYIIIQVVFPERFSK